MFEEIIMRNSDEFKDRVAVITGGSEGIGRNFVRVLCEVGCKVYFCARNAEHGKVVENAYGPKADFVQVDLAVPEQINAFAAHVRERARSIFWSTTLPTMIASSFAILPWKSATACGS